MNVFADAPSAAPPNIVLVVIDTLRADRLGAYGCSRKTSPHLDSFARQGVLFENAISQASWTLPSVASLLTSSYVQQHGLATPRSPKLAKETTTLAEALRDRGYATAAFTQGGFFDRQYGLDRGFDLYINKGELENRYLEDEAPAARRWMEAHRSGPFFLLIHSLDTHMPYDPHPAYLHHFDKGYHGPVDALKMDNYFAMLYSRSWDPRWGRRAPGPGYHAGRIVGQPPSPGYLKNVDQIRGNPRDRARIVSLYDDCVASMDDSLGRFLDGIREMGLDKNTVVIVTADHGEELGEKGRIGHNIRLYDTLIHVPLVMRGPGLGPPGARVSRQVRSIDVAPTVLDLAGVHIPETFKGESLLPILSRPAAPRPAPEAFSSCDGYVTRQAVFSVRTGRWKLIFDRDENTRRLYDLASDPGENRNLYRFRRKISRDLERKLAAWMGSGQKPLARTTIVPRVEAALRAAGYIR